MADGGEAVAAAVRACGDDRACLAARGVHLAPAAALGECRVQGWSQVFYVAGGCAVEHAPVHGKAAR
jgi:hypothetical protein